MRREKQGLRPELPLQIMRSLVMEVAVAVAAEEVMGEEEEEEEEGEGEQVEEGEVEGEEGVEVGEEEGREIEGEDGRLCLLPYLIYLTPDTSIHPLDPTSCRGNASLKLIRWKELLKRL